jgi:hypothetical protein
MAPRKFYIVAILTFGCGITTSWLQSSMSIISACYPNGLLGSASLLDTDDYYWPWRTGLIPLSQDRGLVEHRDGGAFRIFQHATFEHGVTTVGTANLFLPDDHQFWQLPGSETNPAISAPGWSMASDRQENTRLLKRHPASRWTEVAAGWPLKSFKGAIRTDYKPHGLYYAYEWSVPLGPRSAVGRSDDPAFIPFHPMPGLIINAALYGTACLIPIAVFRSGHRRRRAARRTRAGLCPACAYPAIGLTTCPECATPVPPRPTKRSRRTRTRPPR